MENTVTHLVNSYVQMFSQETILFFCYVGKANKLSRTSTDLSISNSHFYAPNCNIWWQMSYQSVCWQSRNNTTSFKCTILNSFLTTSWFWYVPIFRESLNSVKNSITLKRRKITCYPNNSSVQRDQNVLLWGFPPPRFFFVTTQLWKGICYCYFTVNWHPSA